MLVRERITKTYRLNDEGDEDRIHNHNEYKYILI